MPRGQASVEFLVVLSIVVVILAMMGFFVYQKYVRGSELKIFVQGNRVINTVADNINEINAVGSGFSQYFTLPESLYGSREYTIHFFENESLAYLKGGSFLRGIELHWSAPISTVEVECLRSECNTGCNETPLDHCLKVNGTMLVRAANDNGVVYLTYPYNIFNNGTGRYITPVFGNLTYNNESCVHGSFIYIYQNTENNSLNLVLQHNSSVDETLEMDFSDVIGDLNIAVSDDLGELTTSGGVWQLKADECSGGVITFRKGIHMCINSDMRQDFDWVWLDGDGSVVGLDSNSSLCLSYP